MRSLQLLFYPVRDMESGHLPKARNTPPAGLAKAFIRVEVLSRLFLLMSLVVNGTTMKNNDKVFVLVEQSECQKNTL